MNDSLSLFFLSLDICCRRDHGVIFGRWIAGWISTQNDSSIVHATSAASFRVSVTPRGPDSGAFSTWTEVRNGPTDAATRSRGRRTRERARGTRRARYGRGRKRERVAEARDARGRILSWKMGEQDPLSLSPPSFFLSLTTFRSLSPSLFDEEGAQSGLYEGCRVLSGVRRFGVSTPLVAGKPRRFSRLMRRRPLRRGPYFRSLFLPLYFFSPLRLPLLSEISDGFTRVTGWPGRRMFL